MFKSFQIEKETVSKPKGSLLDVLAFKRCCGCDFFGKGNIFQAGKEPHRRVGVECLLEVESPSRKGNAFQTKKESPDQKGISYRLVIVILFFLRGGGFDWRVGSRFFLLMCSLFSNFFTRTVDEASSKASGA